MYEVGGKVYRCPELIDKYIQTLRVIPNAIWHNAINLIVFSDRTMQDSANPLGY